MLINFPPWLEKNLKFMSEIAINAFKLSTMVGENFEIQMSEITRNAYKFLTMAG